MALPGEVVHSPTGQALPESVDMARALRPLRRWVIRYREEGVDEDATAERIAEDPHAPVIVPARRPDRVLEAALVFEQTRSMRFWDQTLEEFRRLLLRAGVFRKVLRYDLEAGSDRSDGLWLRRLPDRREVPIDAFRRQPDERLVLFFTDALSAAWEDGRIRQLLVRWSRQRVRTTLLHMLPPRMWQATELGVEITTGRIGRVHGPRPGILRWVSRPESYDGVRREPMVLLAAFAPDFMQAWARTLAGCGASRTTALVPGATPQAVAPGPGTAPLPTPREALATFRAAASPLALKLAGHLAAAPLYPPVMRLVQQAVLPLSTREHLAEVLLGGLVYRPPEENVGDPPPEETLYDFLPGTPAGERSLRELLLDEEWTPDLEQVLQAVSQHVESRFGRESLNFKAILERPQGVGGLLTVSRSLRPFARVGAAVLQRLGGERAEAGRRLAAAVTSGELGIIPPPRAARYALLLGPKGDAAAGLDALERALSHPDVGNFLSVKRVGLEDAAVVERELNLLFHGRVDGDLVLVAVAAGATAWPLDGLTERLGAAGRPGTAVVIGEIHGEDSLTGSDVRLLSNTDAECVLMAQTAPTALAGFLAAIALLLEDGRADAHGRGFVTLGDLRDVVEQGLLTSSGCRAVRYATKETARDTILARNPRYRSIPDLGLEFLRIPAGSFMMGSPTTEAERSGDETLHEVTLTHEFFMGTTPVTQRAWEALMGTGESPIANPSHFKGDPDLPVESVTWDEAKEFCRRLTARERAAGRLPGQMEFTLPTEAEWEYACRAATEKPFSVGDGENLTPDVANFDGNYPYGPKAQKGEYRRRTTPVKNFPPNPWGLYDMHGNVYEWCEDRYGAYAEDDRVNPLGPETGAYRVQRGGSWFSDARWCRSAYRNRGDPDIRDYDTGFRVAAVQSRSRQGTRVTEAPRGGGGAVAGKGPRELSFRNMVEIPAGSFLMGSPPEEAGRDENETQHEVTLTRPFRLARYPVTQGQYEAVMGKNPSHFQNAGAEAPVESISYDEGLEFCRRLTEQHHQSGDLPRELIYTLPTEAQWEYACRAGSAGAIYTEAPWTIEGQNNAPALDPIAWYGGNSGVDYEGGYDSSGWPEKQTEHNRAGTHSVGKKDANEWGLHDMLGNVYEWCWDWYGEYPKGAVVDPAGPATGASRVLRGGSWYSIAWGCRSAYRDGRDPADRDNNSGFRVAAVQSGERSEGREKREGAGGRARSPAERGAAARTKAPGKWGRVKSAFKRERG